MHCNLAVNQKGERYMQENQENIKKAGKCLDNAVHWALFCSINNFFNYGHCHK